LHRCQQGTGFYNHARSLAADDPRASKTCRIKRPLAQTADM